MPNDYPAIYRWWKPSWNYLWVECDDVAFLARLWFANRFPNLNERAKELVFDFQEAVIAAEKEQ